jgi:hypothetical protein
LFLMYPLACPGMPSLLAARRIPAENAFRRSRHHGRNAKLGCIGCTTAKSGGNTGVSE